MIKPAGILKNLSIKSMLLIAAVIIGGIIMLTIGKGSAPQVSSADTPAVSRDENSEYAERLENQAAGLINALQGAANAKVMLTLDSSCEYIYATKSTLKEITGEASKQTESLRDYVLINGPDKGQYPILIKQLNPKVKGVAVVCEGGNDPKVQAQIINLLSALFDVPSHRIYVSG